ncbi:MAG: ATP-binding protein [Nocardioides sp.]|nr:ATP-binding protein [Nocardioides sp.]
MRRPRTERAYGPGFEKPRPRKGLFTSGGGEARGARKPRGDAWALNEVRGHLTLTNDRIIAWYLAEPQTWSFRAHADLEALITDQASQLADLMGNTIHGRVTTRPYPVRHWAHAAFANAPDPQPGFEEMMQRNQAHMAAHSQADKLVYYGVDLGARDVAVRTLAKFSASAAEREMAAISERLDTVNRVMSRPGFSARPATGHDLEWMIARSLALGARIPVPEPGEAEETHLDADDLAEWFESVSWSAEPLAPTMQITSSVGGRQETTHVCVLTISRIGDIEVPESHAPWMAKSDALGFPVEWSFRVEPRTPEDVSREMSSLTRRIDGQVSHWSDDHGKRPPKQLSRQASRAADVEDEMRSEFTGLSTRTKGWYRVAVTGRSEAEALDKAQKVVDLYRPQIKVTRQLGQYHLAREFVPGEPLATTAHARKFPVLKVAAGLPAVTAEVGDKRGFYLGETSAMASRAVLMDPWYLTEVMEQAGLIPIIGTPGSGKSTLMGVVIYMSILSGIHGVAMDPAGRLQRLMTLPEIGGGVFNGRQVPPLARSVDVLGGRPGSLSPYAVVPDPNPELIRLETLSDHEYAERLHREQTASVQQRRDLTVSVLRSCLPVTLANNEDLLKRIRAKVMQAPADRGADTSTIVKLLMEGDSNDQEIARELGAARERELGRLFFGNDFIQSEQESAGQRRTPFTFYNLKGLNTPPEHVPREEWSAEELLARPIMTLAAWSAVQLIYRSDPNERKLFALDEAHEVTQSSGGTGRALVHKLSSDSRKNNCAALVSTQNASAILGSDINNFVGAAFVGRTQDEKAQKDALKLLGKPEGLGYESILARLSPRTRRGDEQLGYREFIYRDGLGGDTGHGGMEIIKVTLNHHPGLQEALNTTADPTRRVAKTLAGESSTAAEEAV